MARICCPTKDIDAQLCVKLTEHMSARSLETRSKAPCKYGVGNLQVRVSIQQFHRCVCSHARGICLQCSLDVQEHAREDVHTSVIVSGSIEAVTVDSDVATKSTEID